MIHFLSVHLLEFWIEPQIKFITTFVPSATIRAYYHPNIKIEIDNFIKMTKHERTGCAVGEHRSMLYKLALTLSDKNSNDIVCMIDSDAFPVDKNFENYIEDKLKRYDMVAPAYPINSVQFRRENKKQPHVVCMAMRIGTYEKVFGFENKLIDNYWFKNRKIQAVESKEISWFELPLINKTPTTRFKIYANILYHHYHGTQRGFFNKEDLDVKNKLCSDLEFWRQLIC